MYTVSNLPSLRRYVRDINVLGQNVGTSYMTSEMTVHNVVIQIVWCYMYFPVTITTTIAQHIFTYC